MPPCQLELNEPQALRPHLPFGSAVPVTVLGTCGEGSSACVKWSPAVRLGEGGSPAGNTEQKRCHQPSGSSPRCLRATSRDKPPAAAAGCPLEEVVRVRLCRCVS